MNVQTQQIQQVSNRAAGVSKHNGVAYTPKVRAILLSQPLSTLRPNNVRVAVHQSEVTNVVD